MAMPPRVARSVGTIQARALAIAFRFRSSSCCFGLPLPSLLQRELKHSAELADEHQVVVTPGAGLSAANHLEE